MLQRKLNLLISLLMVGGVYFLTLFLFSGTRLIAENAIAVIAVWLAGTFLLGGMLAGVLAVVVAGLAAESLLALPGGTVMIASACAGLLMLHLSKVQSLSLPWRGTTMVTAGTIAWVGLLELMQFMQPDNLLSGSEITWAVLKQGLVAIAIWLSLLIVAFGIGSLFKQSRPARII